jgi:hypothetical protein
VKQNEGGRSEVKSITTARNVEPEVEAELQQCCLEETETTTKENTRKALGNGENKEEQEKRKGKGKGKWRKKWKRIRDPSLLPLKTTRGGEKNFTRKWLSLTLFRNKEDVVSLEKTLQTCELQR